MIAFIWPVDFQHGPPRALTFLCYQPLVSTPSAPCPELPYLTTLLLQQTPEYGLPVSVSGFGPQITTNHKSNSDVPVFKKQTSELRGDGQYL